MMMSTMDDPLKPSLPVSYPLSSLDQLENRSYFSSFHFLFNKCSVPLSTSKRPPSHEKRPRLLVCHDMMGGYQDDKWIQGSPNSEAYSLWHWHLIDVFVYFAHSLVTLPPPCWTNAAHKHGVQVLGTFITEWREGAALCKRLLASKESARMYASRLSELAAVLGFDGWLINIENKVEREQIVNLQEFVNHLTVSMHELVPGSVVIWYDSVTKDGKLQWQDCLNEMNKCFFDLCDGIFTNYTWKKEFPEKSALIAGERRCDVYMGVDVFGRNTFGGGGFQCNVALKAAREAGVSAAIFAPGWVYETKQGPSFQAAQNRWWGLVAECWPSAQHYPLQLPFFSNFNQGYGKGIYIDGKNISRMQWSNISCQNLQPLLHAATDPNEGCLEVIVSCEQPAYSGGACVKFSGEMEEKTHCFTVLYDGDIAISHSLVYISYSVKVGANAGFSLLFKIRNEQGVKFIFLVDSNESCNHQKHDKYSSSIAFEIPTNSRPFPGSEEWNIREYAVEVTEGTLEGIFAVSFFHKLNYLTILDVCKDNTNSRIAKSFLATSATVGTETRSTRVLYEAVLGHTAISCSHSHDFFHQVHFEHHKVSWDALSAGQRVVSLMLTWVAEGRDTGNIAQYNIYVTKAGSTDEELEYLGVAMVKAFYVSQLTVPQGCKALNFYLQVCCACGSSQSLEDAQQTTVPVPSA